jgi:hypothetical protein
MSVPKARNSNVTSRKMSPGNSPFIIAIVRNKAKKSEVINGIDITSRWVDLSVSIKMRSVVNLNMLPIVATITITIK